MSTAEELRIVALSEFARAGYGATSLQRIAELAELSKPSVLYHYSSKEALLEAAISPALERMDAMVSALEHVAFTPQRRSAFVVDFVDFLLAHRLEVHLFINQGRGLEGVPVMRRANSIVVRLSTYFCTAVSTTQDQLRFGVALGGAAYTLVSLGAFGPPSAEEPSLDEVRDALVAIMSDLLAPVSVRPVAV